MLHRAAALLLYAQPGLSATLDIVIDATTNVPSPRAPATFTGQIKQVSFNDAADDDADSRDASITSDGKCFVYTSEVRHGKANLSSADWRIWRTCGVFDDAEVHTLVSDPAQPTGTEYNFAGASDDGNVICYSQDLAGSGGVDIVVTDTSKGMTVKLTDSLSSGKKRNSKRCAVSGDGSSVAFDSDEELTGAAVEDNKEQVYFVPDWRVDGRNYEMLKDESTEESTWAKVSGDGAYVLTASKALNSGLDEIWMYKSSTKELARVSRLTEAGACNRTRAFEVLTEKYGIDELVKENLATEAKLGNAQTQCSTFAAMGIPGFNAAGTIDAGDNGGTLSDDGRFVTITAAFDLATIRGTYEPEPAAVSTRNLFLFDAWLGLTWQLTHEGVPGPELSRQLEDFCCAAASTSMKRGTCSRRNEIRGACCWQRPCYHPIVSGSLSGDGTSIVFSGDGGPRPGHVNMDWEIYHYHIPTSTTRRITATGHKDYDDFYPSISRKGDVLAWTSDFNHETKEVITRTNQIFAAKLTMGCSLNKAASNYLISPDVETCCAWEVEGPLLPPSLYAPCELVTLKLAGAAAKMKARLPFASDVAEFCTRYTHTVRDDVACSLGVPPSLVKVMTTNCDSWDTEGIQVQVGFNKPAGTGGLSGWAGLDLVGPAELANRLKAQMEDPMSRLWSGYLTKTLRKDLVGAMTSHDDDCPPVETGVCDGHQFKPAGHDPASPTIELKWNMFSSEWGAYEVEGCLGVNPTLRLTAGITYTFVQSDASNWYHPVGFAYVAGGAHTECKAEDGTVGECPELGGETPSSTIQYFVGGEAVTSDESGFGLDAYEPLFFNSQDWWGEQNAAHQFKVTLTIPADATYRTLYYFCHIHAGMSAKIEVVGSSTPANKRTELNAAVLGGESEASALAIFSTIQAESQEALSEYDRSCGTHASSSFSPLAGHSTCKGKTWLCGADASTAYAQCLESIDCQMHHDMAVAMPAGASKFATFARQMIAHHQNAVAMAKVLAKFHTDEDYPEAGTEDQDKEWSEGLIRGIINVQNFQIQQLQAWLDANPALAGTAGNCYTDVAAGSTCRDIKAAYKNSACCAEAASKQTLYKIGPA